MTSKNSRSFCYDIYKNLAIWTKNNQLSYNPCSFYDGFIKTNDQFSLKEIWNSPEHQALKNLVDQDLPVPGCSACYQAEEQGLTSRRLGSRELYEVYFKDTDIELSGPQSIDYSVGNLCNLRCMICGPADSTSWIPDYQKIYPLRDITKFKFDKFNQIEVTDTELLKNIVNVHFHGGGEPLLSNNHVNLLKKIQEVKGLSDVHVFYNTNGTVRASDEVLDIWSQCSLVELYFSIDDIGARFNYQRTGADWNKLLENLSWYQEHMPVNHMFKINCTWSYLNIYYLDELVDWYRDNFNQNRLGDPVNLIFQKALGDFALEYLSPKVLQHLRDKFKNYAELLDLLKMIAESENDHLEFFDLVAKIDQVRNTAFAQICPEWSQILINSKSAKHINIT